MICRRLVADDEPSTPLGLIDEFCLCAGCLDSERDGWPPARHVAGS